MSVRSDRLTESQCVEAKRQLAVAALADEGLSINEIADYLDLHPLRVRVDMTLMGFDVGVCNAGHPYSPTTTLTRRGRKGNTERVCLICRAAQSRKPCRRCGGPKPPGKRRSLCDGCRR